MFSDKPPGVVQPAYYAALKTGKTVIITDDEHDVFGDGSVIMKSAPGHTPGIKSCTSGCHAPEASSCPAISIIFQRRAR